MATPTIEKSEVISEQPKPSIGFNNALLTATPPIPRIPILEILTPITYLVLKHGKGAGCCGATVQYLLQGPDNQILLRGGEHYSCTCRCNPGLTPVIIEDLQGAEILQVTVEKSGGCFSTTMLLVEYLIKYIMGQEVEISALPGNPIGTIHIDGLTFAAASNVSEIMCSVPTVIGQKIFIERSKNSLGQSEFFFKDSNGYSVGVVRHERTPWRYVLELADVDPITKANLLGFTIMFDIFKLAQIAQQRHQRRNSGGDADDGDGGGDYGGDDGAGGGGGGDGGGGGGGDGGGD